MDCDFHRCLPVCICLRRNVLSANTQEGAKHPTPAVYTKIAVILTLITLVEFGAFYVEQLKPIFVPLLSILSIAKVIMVAGYYMHLKFDKRVFTYLLLCGILIATGVIFSLMALFFYAHPIKG